MHSIRRVRLLSGPPERLGPIRRRIDLHKAKWTGVWHSRIRAYRIRPSMEHAAPPREPLCPIRWLWCQGKNLRNTSRPHRIGPNRTRRFLLSAVAGLPDGKLCFGLRFRTRTQGARAQPSRISLGAFHRCLPQRLRMARCRIRSRKRKLRRHPQQHTSAFWQPPRAPHTH